MKRIVDLTLALVGLATLAPLLLAVSLLIRLLDGAPIFFRQERIGRRGQPFHIWKFRTMRAPAPGCDKQLTVSADPRITRLGRLLRKTKIDELPQLFNVVLGDMSLVGPRPEVPRYVEKYDPQQRAVLDFRPGLTGPASIRFRNESELLAAAEDPEACYIHEIMPEKIRLSLEYHGRATVWSDLRLLLHTAVALLRPSGSMRPSEPSSESSRRPRLRREHRPS